jgi:Protein of unknown function (DUF3025)
LQLPADWDPGTPPSFAQLQRDVQLPAGLAFTNAGADKHYELRIAEDGELPTREASWHDAFNGLIWQQWPHTKRAINSLQVEDIRRVGSKTRTRRQYAITHFDEAGAIVCLRDQNQIARWDAHDWPGLFLELASLWQSQTAMWIFGHALLEHLQLKAHLELTAKAIVLQLPSDIAFPPSQMDVDQRLAQAILFEDALADPKLLRPLPISGVPGFWPEQTVDFYQTAPCFRPKRLERGYAPPLAW